MDSDRTIDTTPRDAQRWLYRCADRSPFAFARGSEYVRFADHTVWARLFDDRLWSLRSGACLAYRHGQVFYDADSGEPLYYEPPLARLPALRVLPAPEGALSTPV